MGPAPLVYSNATSGKSVTVLGFKLQLKTFTSPFTNDRQFLMLGRRGQGQFDRNLRALARFAPELDRALMRFHNLLALGEPMTLGILRHEQ